MKTIYLVVKEGSSGTLGHGMGSCGLYYLADRGYFNYASLKTSFPAFLTKEQAQSFIDAEKSWGLCIAEIDLGETEEDLEKLKGQ